MYDIGGLARPFDWFVVGCEESFESGESVEEDQQSWEDGSVAKDGVGRWEYKKIWFFRHQYCGNVRLLQY